MEQPNTQFLNTNTNANANANTNTNVSVSVINDKKDEYTFPPLFSKDKQGKTKSWSIKVINKSEYSEIITIYGYNRKIETKSLVHKGKNIGKKNETTHYTQAIADAKSKWDKKHDIEGYTQIEPKPDTSTNIDLKNKNQNQAQKINLSEPFLPMLAQDYHKYKNKVKFPCFVQPKLDGYRMIFQKDKMVSRGGKSYEILEKSDTNLKKELMMIRSKYPDFILDGELYIHDKNISFESYGILRKKEITKESDLNNLSKIEYHIYDLVDINDPQEPYHRRRTKLFGVEESFKGLKNIKFVKSLLTQEQDLKQNIELFIFNNYEGGIIRNTSGVYLRKYRSYDLLKYKNFDDDEFEIVGSTHENSTSRKTDTMSEKKLIVWICKTKEGKCFNVRPQGTETERDFLYNRANEFVGSKLWVKYFGLTETSKVPRFPSTKTNSYKSYIRDIAF